jgi:hypothetical protein
LLFSIYSTSTKPYLPGYQQLVNHMTLASALYRICFNEKWQLMSKSRCKWQEMRRMKLFLLLLISQVYWGCINIANFGLFVDRKWSIYLNARTKALASVLFFLSLIRFCANSTKKEYRKRSRRREAVCSHGVIDELFLLFLLCQVL